MKYVLGSIGIVAILVLAITGSLNTLLAQLSDDENLTPIYPILESCSGRDHNVFPVYEEILKGEYPFGENLNLVPNSQNGIAWVPGTELPGAVGAQADNLEIDEPFDYRETDSVDLWRRQYHSTVATIVAERASSASEESTVKCLQREGDEEEEESAGQGSLLMELASKLPPWKEAAALEQLSPSDTWTVLLEYLRLYECALTERYFYLFSDAIRERAVLAEAEGKEFDWNRVFREYFDQDRKIRMELATARPVLNRVIALHLDSGNLQALKGEIECLKRASQDIRIAAALSAEAAACLPRAQDAKGPLRDLLEE